MTTDTTQAVQQLFSELTLGAPTGGGAFILNSGDAGLLRSLDTLSAADASRAVHDGATIAAHAQHLRYGLALMNRWATEGGNPFADATWDEAWRVKVVSDAEWHEIREGLRAEAERWLAALGGLGSLGMMELCGIIGSVAHLAYHLGAVRQIDKSIRGPKEGTFA